MDSNSPSGLARINCRSRFLQGLNSALPNAPLHRILQESGVSLEGLYESGLMAADYARLLRVASDITSTPQLPVQVGLEADIADFGIYGYSLLSCRDPNRMARIAVDYQPLAGYGFDIRVDAREGRLLLHVQDNPVLSGADNLLLLLEFLGATCAIMRSRFAPSVATPVVAAELRHPAPEHLRGLAGALPFPLHFDRPHTAIHLNPDILTVDIDHQGAELNLLFLQRCEAELARLQSDSGPDMVSRVRALIYQAMQTAAPTQHDIASQLHLSPRTMNRRLCELGTSYSKLLTQCRMSLARELLASEGLSVQEISFRLGYAQPNSFYRAYRKHYGRSPRANALK